jgi:NitT/TauT family transport system substrate-binding protein
MKRQFVFIFAAVLLGAVILAAGCTSPAEPEVTELRIGYQPSTHQLAHMTAMEKGWWEQDLATFGVTSITDREFPTGAPEMTAMIAGELDVAYVGAAPFVVAVANSGLDAKIIATANTQGSNIVLRPEYPYEGPEDLKGLKIATFPPGTIQDTLLRNWLRNNNIDPDNDVEIVAMGPGDAITAITAGQVDATFLPHPAPAIIENSGNGRSVVASGEMFPNHACCVVVASGDLITNHPDLTEQIVRTHIRANDYNLENLDEAAEIFARKTGQDVEIIRKSLNEWDGTWEADPNVIIDSVVSYTQVQYELGYIEQPLVKEDLFDTSFYDKIQG